MRSIEGRWARAPRCGGQSSNHENTTPMKNLKTHWLMTLLIAVPSLGCQAMERLGLSEAEIEVGDPDTAALKAKIEEAEDPRPYRFAYVHRLIQANQPEEGVLELARAQDYRVDERALAWSSLLESDRQEMLELANRALELSPTDPDAMYAAARAHYWSRAFDDATEQILEHLERDTTSTRGWILKFLIEAKGGRRDLAVGTAEQIARNNFYFERRVAGEDWLRLAGLYRGDPDWTSSFDRLCALGELEAPVTDVDPNVGYPPSLGQPLRRPMDERPYFGMDLDVSTGAIRTVHAGSIAESAGVSPGDVLVSINGQELAGGATPRSMESLVNKGDEVLFEVLRDGRPQSMRATATTWVHALKEAAVALEKADEHYAGGEYAEAEILYRRAHALVRGRSTAMLDAAIWSRIQKGEREDGLTELRALIDKYPEDARLRHTLAQQEFLRGRPAEAEETIAHLGDRFPYSGLVPAYQGLIALAEGDRGAAVELAQQAATMGDGGWALNTLKSKLETRKQVDDSSFATNFFRGLAIGLVAASASSGSSYSSSSSYMPSGPGITQPDPVGDQVFSNSINAWYQ